jgi:hypothetical protein
VLRSPDRCEGGCAGADPATGILALTVEAARLSKEGGACRLVGSPRPAATTQTGWLGRAELDAAPTASRQFEEWENGGWGGRERRQPTGCRGRFVSDFEKGKWLGEARRRWRCLYYGGPFCRC